MRREREGERERERGRERAREHAREIENERERERERGCTPHHVVHDTHADATHHVLRHCTQFAKVSSLLNLLHTMT